MSHWISINNLKVAHADPWIHFFYCFVVSLHTSRILKKYLWVGIVIVHSHGKKLLQNDLSAFLCSGLFGCQYRTQTRMSFKLQTFEYSLIRTFGMYAEFASLILSQDGIFIAIYYWYWFMCSKRCISHTHNTHRGRP